MFISYAQNYEDIVLWRVLGHIDNGTYVDVGAADPTEYSVTKAFYDRGWSGINVEPLPAFVEALRAVRERDTTFSLCAGEPEGRITLHSVPGTGLSTTTMDHLAEIAEKNFEVVDMESEVRRLDALLEDAGLRDKDIHFLKVDVEGAEESVLRSIDLALWRPWVVVVEATEPLTTQQTHTAWEHLLLDHRYRFCLFDGLNRFYLAAEHDDLAAKLSYPAGVFDQPFTVGAGDHELASVAERLLAEKNELWESYQRLRDENQRTLDGAAHTRQALAESNASYDKLNAEHDSALRSYAALQEQFQGALAGYDAGQEQLKLALAGTENIRRAYEDALSGHERLQAEYDNTVAGYDRLSAELAQTLEGYERLQAEHRAALDGYERLQAEYHAALDGYERLQAEYRGALQAYNRADARTAVEAERAADLAVTVSQLTDELEESSRHREDLERRLREAELEATAMKASLRWRLTHPTRSRTDAPKS